VAPYDGDVQAMSELGLYPVAAVDKWLAGSTSDMAVWSSLATVAAWRCIRGRECRCVDAVYICKFNVRERTE